MKKVEPRKIPMGVCGHKIQAVRYDGLMRWFCAEGHGYEAKFKANHLVPRGKAK